MTSASGRLYRPPIVVCVRTAKHGENRELSQKNVLCGITRLGY